MLYWKSRPNGSLDLLHFPVDPVTVFWATKVLSRRSMVASSEEVLAPMSSWELPCVGGSPAVTGVEVGRGIYGDGSSSSMFYHDINIYHISL